MYLAMQIQTGQEKRVQRSFQQRVETLGMKGGIVLHTFLRRVLKVFPDGRRNETMENILPGSLIAEIKDGYSDDVYYLLSNTAGVLKILGEVSEEEFQHMQHMVEEPQLQVHEPKAQDFTRGQKARRLEKRFDRMVKEVKQLEPSVDEKYLERLKKKFRERIASIKAQSQQYIDYLRNLHLFAGNRVVRGKQSVLEFPLQLVEEIGLAIENIGLFNPVTLAITLSEAQQYRL